MDTQAGDISNQEADKFNKSLPGPVVRGDLGKAADEYDAKRSAAVAGMETRLGAGRAKLAASEGALAGAAKPPDLQLTPPPQPQMTSPEQIWGSLAMILAGIGSLKSRQHMTTALNAAAGVMNAYHKNDMETYEVNYRTWKASNDNAIKIAQYENKTYMDAMRNEMAAGRLAVAEQNLDVRETLAKLTALMHSYEDPMMQQRLQNEGVNGAIKVAKERDRILDRADKASKKADEHAKIMFKGMKFKEAWAAYSNSAEGQLLKQQNPNALAQKFFQMQRQIAPETDNRGKGDPKDRAAATRIYNTQFKQQLGLYGSKVKDFETWYREDWPQWGDEKGSDKPFVPQGPEYFMKRGAPTPDQARADQATKNKDEMPSHDLFSDGARIHLPKGMSPEEARKKYGKGTPVILPDGTEGVVP